MNYDYFQNDQEIPFRVSIPFPVSMVTKTCQFLHLLAGQCIVVMTTMTFPNPKSNWSFPEYISRNLEWYRRLSMSTKWAISRRFWNYFFSMLLFQNWQSYNDFDISPYFCTWSTSYIHIFLNHIMNATTVQFLNTTKIGKVEHISDWNIMRYAWYVRKIHKNEYWMSFKSFSLTASELE